MSSYDYWIQVNPMEPPIGGIYPWCAVAIIKEIGTGRADDSISLKEHFGKSKEEAELKAEAEAKEWIKNKVT